MDTHHYTIVYRHGMYNTEGTLMQTVNYEPTSSACLLSVEKLQGKNFIRKVRECHKKGKQSSKTKNNKTLAMKQIQRTLAPPQGLHIIF